MMGMDLKERNILVYGLGRTGIAVANFLSREGARVTAVDDRSLEELTGAIENLKSPSLDVRGDFTGQPLPAETSFVVPSPGVPPHNAVLQEAARRGIAIISEIELAFRCTDRPVIAITGTNGKTTTTELIGHILKSWGKQVFVGGNIGTPLVDVVSAGSSPDYLVVEVSSFQLLHINAFRPKVAVVLNMGIDHLDYHGSAEAYRAAKARIAENMGPDDLLILRDGDSACEALGRTSAAETLFFSSSRILERGIFLEGSCIVLMRQGKGEERYSLEAFKLKGRHNIENCMAAVAAVRYLGCPPDLVQEAMGSFRGLPHRVEYVDSLEGVSFFNDSKGTNVDAVMAALESFHEPVILLMGGRGKDEDFSRLASLVEKKVKKLVLFGEAGPVIESVLGRFVATERVGTLGEAVETALRGAETGNVVLLSPGCASFDEFRDYRERGDYFKSRVADMVTTGTLAGWNGK